MYTFVVCWYGE